MVLEKLRVKFLVILNEIPLNESPSIYKFSKKTFSKGVFFLLYKCIKIKKNMKNLKNYLNESVWVVEDNKESILNDVKKFIKDNYGRLDIDRCKFIFDDKTNKYIINCDQPLNLKATAKQITNGFFKWGKVIAYFDCSAAEITSLEGAPDQVSGKFNCSNCDKLTSLEGAPKIVYGDFMCRYCHRLTSLEGGPEKVQLNFNCENCRNLKSLKGAPKKVGGYFNCEECPKLRSLDGIGKVEGEIFSDID